MNESISPTLRTTRLVKYEKPDKEFLKAVTLPAFLHAFGGANFFIPLSLFTSRSFPLPNVFDKENTSAGNEEKYSSHPPLSRVRDMLSAIHIAIIGLGDDDNV